jgi:hypothetical protein
MQTEQQELRCDISLEDIAASDTLALLHREFRKAKPETRVGANLDQFAKTHNLEIGERYRIEGPKGVITTHPIYGLTLTLTSKFATKSLPDFGALTAVTGSYASAQFDARTAGRAIKTIGLISPALDNIQRRAPRSDEAKRKAAAKMRERRKLTLAAEVQL